MEEENKPIFDPLYRSLSEEEKRAAAQNLIKYPRVIRSDINRPVPGQTHASISLRLLTEPHKTKSGAPVYGLIKVNMVAGGENLLIREVAEHIKDINSVDRHYVTQIGYWCPITSDDSFCQKRLNVKLQGVEEGHPEVVIEDMKTMTNIKNQDADEAKRAELEERIQTLRDERPIDDDPTTLQFYTMKRVVELNLREELERKRVFIKETEVKLLRLHRQLEELDQAHANYTEEWLANLNASRKKVGIMPQIWSERNEVAYQETRRVALEHSAEPGKEKVNQ
jgi:hypothetical protein